MYCTKCGEKAMNGFILCKSCFGEFSLESQNIPIGKRPKKLTAGVGLVLAMLIVGLIFYSVYIFDAWDMLNPPELTSSWWWNRWESPFSPIFIGFVRMVQSVGVVIYSILFATHLKKLSNVKNWAFILAIFMILEIIFRFMYMRLQVDMIFLFIYYGIFFYGLWLTNKLEKEDIKIDEL